MPIMPHTSSWTVAPQGADQDRESRAVEDAGAEQMHLRFCDVAHRIAPTLTMMKDYVDYWAVLVANTSDNTAAVVDSLMKPVPGQVVEERLFTDFASARNRILQVGPPWHAALPSGLHGHPSHQSSFTDCLPA